MITKERLKKLIEECATIYTFCYYQTRKDIVSIDTSIYKKKEIIGNLFYCGIHIVGIENIFETKEDAEFSLEFQNITRTETLNLPTWEELNKKVDTIPNMFWQIAKCSEFILFLQTDKTLNNTQIILRGNDDTYNWGLTKENYLEACKIAKKLFLGEK